MEYNYNEVEIRRTIEIEGFIDEKQDKITTYLTKPFAKPLSEKDSRLVGKFGKCIVDFERISDY